MRDKGKIELGKVTMNKEYRTHLECLIICISFSFMSNKYTHTLGFLAQNNTKVFWMLSKTKLMPFKKVRLSRALFTYI
jgi:hypothetical protein